MGTLLLLLKAHVKAHARRLASGKVVNVGAYVTKTPAARPRLSAKEAAALDSFGQQTLDLFDFHSETQSLSPKPAPKANPAAPADEQNSYISKEQPVKVEAAAALTDEQRNKIAKNDVLWRKYGDAGEGGRGAWKASARAGERDALWAEHLAIEKAAADEEKARRQTKNQAWRDKNLPKLAAAKRARAAIEDEQRERARAEAERLKAAVKREGEVLAEMRRGAFSAVPFTGRRPAGPKLGADGLPLSGTVSADDPSIYGSWLLGHEGESWERVRAYYKPTAPAEKRASTSAVVGIRFNPTFIASGSPVDVDGGPISYGSIVNTDQGLIRVEDIRRTSMGEDAGAWVAYGRRVTGKAAPEGAKAFPTIAAPSTPPAPKRTDSKTEEAMARFIERNRLQQYRDVREEGGMLRLQSAGAGNMARALGMAVASTGSGHGVLVGVTKDAFLAAAEARIADGAARTAKEDAAVEAMRARSSQSSAYSRADAAAAGHAAGRVYLAVPFASKDSAKSAGAKWDAEARKWFWPGAASAMPAALRKFYSGPMSGFSS